MAFEYSQPLSEIKNCKGGSCLLDAAMAVSRIRTDHYDAVGCRYERGDRLYFLGKCFKVTCTVSEVRIILPVVGRSIYRGSYTFPPVYLSYTTQLLAASSRLEKFVPDTLEDMASDIGQDALTTITRDQAVYDAASQAAQAAEVKLCLLVPMIMVNTFIQVTEAGLCYVF